jgi:gas vesicle protein
MATPEIDKQEARHLFMLGWEQKRIATVMNRTEQTINKWCKDGQWHAQRDIHRSKLQASKELISDLLHHQLSIIKLIVSKKKQELAENIDPTSQELEKLLIQSKEADLVSKFFAQIRDQETQWDKLVSIASELIDFVQSKNLELAKKLIPLIDEFIQTKRATQ